MVYTLTLNPALDYVMYMKQMEQGTLARAERETLDIGGKGINVSCVLHTLGVATKALGFSAGITGRILESYLQEKGIDMDLIRLEQGMTRINVKLKETVRETEINGAGPAITKQDIDRLSEKMEQIKTGDYLVLAGSLPKSLPEDTYEQIAAPLAAKGVLLVVDTTGEKLRRLLPYHPFLIKPNSKELEELFPDSNMTEEGMKAAASSLRKEGARNVLISMGQNGSLLLKETGSFHRLKVPKGKVHHSVGAGDSMVAGFLAGFLESGRYDIAHKKGAAAGAATAFSDSLGTKEQIERLFAAL